MAKNLNQNVSVKFTADSRELQKSVKSLQSQLQDLSTMKFSVDDGSLKKAAESAKDLQKYLRQATDASTGNLDVSKLSNVLKQAGRDINEISADLIKLGPQGNQAFMTLARSVSQAQIPLKKTNKMMDELWTTMKNTARWQLTSSAMHGFMSAVSNAIRYAEDLNESLNNIRIVTGQSEAQMERFAVKANKAAKAMSTTTTAYTDAALIFYQQGLGDSQVEERTNATIKMSQVAGESAKEVSSYMTAIWNNFDDGTKSLEYYGDAMAALGATTAASSAEIAEGLEKFAAIGDTVGLSFEYATAAVATVVDKTQQSADTVGTAFKTIFSRLQGLSLGETLDDGTTLNKYSQALEAVGVNIKDQFGSLRDMDDILDDLGTKWQMLSRDQQMALAQTVAGTRQYSQLISLMDNYEDFKVNIEVATESEGTLDVQSKIFQESWEGASNRAQAALEDFYDSIINDDAIIGLINGFADLVNGVTDFVDKIGGVKTVLSAVGAFFATKFSGKISEEIGRLGENFNIFTGKAKDDMISLQNTMISELNKNSKRGTPFDKVESESIANYLAAKQKLAIVSETLNESEKMNLEHQVATIGKMSEKIELLAQEAEKQKEILATREREIRAKAVKTAGDNAEAKGQSKTQARTKQAKDFDGYTKALKKKVQAEQQATKTLQQFRKNSDLLLKSVKSQNGSLDESKKSISNYIKELEKTTGESKETARALEALSEAKTPDDISAALGELEMHLEGVEQQAQQTLQSMTSLSGKEQGRLGLTADEIQELVEGYRDEANAVDELNENLDAQKEASKNLEVKHAVTGTERIVNMVSAAGSLFAMYNAIKGLGSIWADEDATVGEKILATMTTMGTVMPLIKTYFEAMSVATNKDTIAKVGNAFATGGLVGGIKTLTASIWANTAAWFSNPITAVIAIALLAVVAVIGAVSAALDAQTEKHKQNAEAANKEADAAKEAADANKQLVDEYERTLKTYKETGEGKAELAAAAEKVAEAYKIEGAALAALTGDYSDFTEAVKKARIEELEKGKKKSESARDANGQVFIDTMREGVGNWSDGEYKAHFGGGASSADEKKVQDAVKNAAKNGKGYKYIKADGNDIDFKGVGQDAKSMADAYEEVQRLVEEAGATMTDAEKQNSESYQAMIDWLAKSKDSYEAYMASVEDIKAYAIEETVLKSGSSGSNIDMAAEDVKTLDQYREYKEQIINEIAKQQGVTDKTSEEWEKIVESTEAYLGTLANISELQTQDDAFGSFSEKYGIDQQMAEDYFNSLSDEDKKLFWSIDFNSFKTEEAWRNQMDYLQAKADTQAIQVELNAVSSAKGMLKENMTMEDYANLQNSGIDWGSAKDDIVSYSEFIRMTYEEQVAYLDQLESQYRDKSIRQKELEKAEAEKNLAVNKSSIAETEKTLQEVNKRLQAGDYKNKEEHLALLEEQKALTTTLQGLKASEKALRTQIGQLDTEIELEIKIDAEQDLKDLENALAQSIEKMENIADPITSMFDAISSGLKKTMDEAGNAVYSLSAEAAQAMNELYPGFMQGLTMMEDGTFKVTEEMYNQYFSMEQGILAANTQTTVGKLENLAQEAYAKADYYKQAAEAALKLANGEIENEEDVANAKKVVLEATQNYTEDAGNNILEMTENQLEGKVDADNQTQESAHDTAVYTAKAMSEAGSAIAQGFSGGAKSAIQSLGQVSKAVTLAKKVASGEIQAVNADFLGLAEGATGYTVPTGGVNISAVNTNTVEALEKGIADQLNLNLGDDGADTQAELNAIYSALAEKLQALSDSYRAAGDAAKLTIANLTSSQYEMYESLGKANKKTIQELVEITERYHEINEEIKTQEYLLEKIRKAKDRAYGKNKIALIEKEIKAMQALSEKQQQLYEAQELFLALDKADVVSAFANAQFDEYGNISNYTELLKQAAAVLNQAKKEYEQAQTDAAKERLDEAQKEFDKQKEILAQYEETLQVLREQEEALVDIKNAIQDANFEKLQTELDVKISISEDNLRVIELKLKRLGDSFFRRFEALVLSIDKFDEHEAQIGAYVDYKNALDRDYLNGDISQSDYMKGYQEAKEGIAGQIEAMIELDQQMLHYYGDTLQQADEELRKYTDHMEHLTSVLDHYLSLVDLLGKKKDYGMMRNFLEGKASTVKDQLDVEKANYNMLAGQRDAAKASLDAEIARLGGQDAVNDLIKRDREGALSEDEKYALAAYELLKNNWDDAVKATDAAQEAMLAKTEEWVSAMKAVIENNMAEINETLEKSLTGGTSFDELMDGFDKLNERQEEYLTKTNQMYETTKMIRTANKAMDETDNKVAKQKIKNFIEETKNLQNTTKLSKYELEIQQAKYDLLLAEIALEEAKNAKSTVRLSRDSEGNFGYVYTADQDKVSEAEQAVDDAKNNVYNISLEGQQKYTEKYLQAQQSMYNELTELHSMFINGDIATEEEYQRRKDAILNHYLGDDGVLTTYSKLYGIAVSADAAAMQDNWQREYGEMTKNTETWKVEVNKYLVEMEGQINTWKDVYVTANEAVDGALDNSADATKDVVTESHNLATTVTKEVIPAIDSELTAVRKRTEAYAAQRAEILANIDAYIKMLEQMNMVTKAEGLGFDPDMDYSAAINEYLNAGGKIGDEAYNTLVAQREAKIAWLKTGAAGEDKADQSYWQFEGDERTREIYEALVAGGQYTIEELAKTLGQDWFKENYMSLEELKEQLRGMGIPEEALANLKEAEASTTDAVENLDGGIGDAGKENKEATDAAAAQAREDAIAALAQEHNISLAEAEAMYNQLHATEDGTNATNEAGDKIEGATTTAGEGVEDATTNAGEGVEDATTDAGKGVEGTTKDVGEEVNATLNDVNASVNNVKDAVDGVTRAVGTAAETISAAVGGLADRVTTLEGDVDKLQVKMVTFEGELSALAAKVDNHSHSTSGTGGGGGGTGGQFAATQMQFASGGYTGDWGPEGKLAVLHEKEIVLNASDTENILSAVGMIRDISNIIDFNAGVAALTSLNAIYGTTVGGGSMEQTVTIHAEFPNATNHNEIEEAFNNLVNRASQYAFRK